MKWYGMVVDERKKENGGLITEPSRIVLDKKTITIYTCHGSSYGVLLYILYLDYTHSHSSPVRTV